jgi:hypothetical protein
MMVCLSFSWAEQGARFAFLSGAVAEPGASTAHLLPAEAAFPCAVVHKRDRGSAGFPSPAFCPGAGKLSQISRPRPTVLLSGNKKIGI